MSFRNIFRREKSPSLTSSPSPGTRPNRITDNLARQLRSEPKGERPDERSLSAVKQRLEQQRSSNGIQVARERLEAYGVDELKRHADQLIAIYQPGYATGDQFAIAAALIHNPHLQLFISQGGPGDHSRGVLDFYRQSGIAAQRITIVDVSQARDKTEANALLRKQAEAYRSEMQKAIGLTLDPKQHLLGLDEATRYVGEQFDSQNILRDKIRNAWKLDASQDAQIRSWLGERGIHPEAGEKVAILWSRFSGSKGEAHLEHDTSYTGMGQIITAMPEGYTVIIAGDRYKDPRERDRYDAMIKQARQQGIKVFNLTEFWKDPSSQSWGGNGRVGQLKLYDYFHRHYDTRHLGFRSGNLESLALVGHQVRYMEEPGSSGSRRMQAWKNTPIGYERLEVERVPTLTGQLHKTIARRYKKSVKLAEKLATHAEKSPKGVLKPFGKVPLKIVRKFERGKMRPQWAPGVYHNLNRRERLPVLPGLFRLKLYKRTHSERRGFLASDLAKIRNYFE